MSMNKASRVPGVPTLPKGETVAAYDTYLEAQRAVDHLSDKEFAVQHVTIVGSDLRMVERVTGRLTYSRVAFAGLASGAWFGLVIGTLLWVVNTADNPPLLPAMAIGAAAGIIFSVISYSLTGGKRDFTSSSQIVATTYAVLCAAEHSHRARQLLSEPGAPGLGRSRTGGGLVQPFAVEPSWQTAGSLGSTEPPTPGRPTEPAVPSSPPPSHPPAPHGDPASPITPDGPRH